MASWNFGLLLAVLIVYDFIPANQGLELNPMLIKQAKKLQLRCLNQTGVSIEKMDQLTKTRSLPNDPGLKCFVHCMFDMVGLIDSQNVVHLESLLEVLPEQIHNTINGLVSACGTQKGKDGCDTAYETIKCYIAVNDKFMWDEVIVLLG
ncbi:general odorant-binding protein 69a isoform X1 [Drosophila rhopaloa]|uniref:General odorant-binding protein 69a isoform X1 n=1 Tax=Drosophila rhopaloa TaxID=1041015 RepID=A0A6P4FRQ1_DRORH|nr:general odorant-binding protein 69a isoform X1 [Drosophila rhopaloa]